MLPSMASSSSSHKRKFEHHASSVVEHPGERRKAEVSVRQYDVFINHRGPDVKKTLALELYKSLEKSGIRAFLDSEEKEPGESFPSTIETAIGSARVHIAIFSKGYAESPWCLDELVFMRKTEAKIIPMFYEVKPWELRHINKGSYDQAFKDYEKKSRHTEMLTEWKEALDRMSYVAGYETNKENAADVCKEIVSAVQKQMRRNISLPVAKYPVGLPKLVQDLERRCLHKRVRNFDSQCAVDKEGQKKTQILCIDGMGGAGKTTLSKELFNRNCSKYTRTSFLYDVREASARKELPLLQIKLLKDLFDENHPSFTSTDEGINYLQDRLGRSPSVSFLIVLDNIDHVEQLDSLLVMDMRNKPGNSLIIITTRDAGVCRRAEIPEPAYNLQGLDKDDATELFCWHAFGQSRPAMGYERLVEQFVEGCGGLPLSLQVLGRHVRGGDQKFWSSALSKVHKTMNQDIKQSLKISFDSLDNVEKNIFMDIACFFIGKPKSMATRVWEGAGWDVHCSLETLKEKFLVQETENNYLNQLQSEGDGHDLIMHDHLRDLGREMADECGAPLRVWKQEDLISLEFKGGFRNILEKIKGRCFHSFFDTSMDFQISFFLAESDDFGEKSASLVWLQLDLNPRVQPSILSWFPLQNLRCLRIRNGSLERLWQSSDQAPLKLKELQIFNTFLEEVPNLGILDDLENVVFDAECMTIKDWSLLESLRMNISTLRLMSFTLEGKLASTSEEWTPPRYLIIRNFKLSEEIVLDKFPMSSLKSLEISNQELVTKIFISGNHCPRLESLKLHSMENLIELDLSRIMTLNSLEVNHCKIFKILTYSACPELRELNLTHLSCLETIRIGNCEQLESVSSLSDVRKLVVFNISQCPKLQELSLVQLSCLERIRIENCESLKIVSGISGLTKLVELDISQCPELEIDLCLCNLYCLERIKIEICKKLKRVSGISKLTKLVELNISQCPELESKLRLPSLYSLEKITVDRCGKLKCLELIDCKKLKTVSGMEDLEELAVLKIRDCPELLQLSAHNLSCWERITIDGCEKLNCHAFYSLLNLKIVTFDIGRAVDGAESTLNQYLFSEADISADAVTEMDIPCSAIPEASMSKIIICGLVVVERATPLQCINDRSQEFHLHEGRWIVTMVIADPKENTSLISSAVEGMCYGIVDKGFRVTLMKGQEWKASLVLQTIDDKLYQN